MADKKKIDFKKQVLPVILVIAALILGFLFKDELIAILGSEGDYSDYYTYEAGSVYTVEADDDETIVNDVVTEPTAEAESTTAATTTATETTTTAETTTTPAPVESEQPDEVEFEYYFRTQAQ